MSDPSADPNQASKREPGPISISGQRTQSSLANAEAKSGSHYKIKVHLAFEASANLELRPYPLDGELQEDGTDEHGRKVYTALFDVRYGEEDEKDLLLWFSKLADTSDGESKSGEATDPDRPQDMLAFPASFSKHQRAHWHKLAQDIGLQSVSEGIGEERHLTVKREDDSAKDKGKPGQWSRKKIEERAKQIWRWCQEEGGSLLNYSQSELVAVLTVTQELPANLVELIAKREEARELMRKLQARDSKGGLELLQATPSLAWVRDDVSGGYPLHIAAYHGLKEVVAFIIQQKTVLEQRDKMRKTPLQVAKRAKQDHIVRLLLDAGAVDLSNGRGESSAGGRGARVSNRFPGRPAPSQARPSGSSEGNATGKLTTAIDLTQQQESTAGQPFNSRQWFPTADDFCSRESSPRQSGADVTTVASFLAASEAAAGGETAKAAASQRADAGKSEVGPDAVANQALKMAMETHEDLVEHVCKKDHKPVTSETEEPGAIQPQPGVADAPKPAGKSTPVAELIPDVELKFVRNGQEIDLPALLTSQQVIRVSYKGLPVHVSAIPELSSALNESVSSMLGACSALEAATASLQQHTEQPGPMPPSANRGPEAVQEKPVSPIDELD